MWEALPTELAVHVFKIRNQLIQSERSAQFIQSRWKGYRTRVLIGRFHMLKYLQVFREFNPSLVIFLCRARL